MQLFCATTPLAPAWHVDGAVGEEQDGGVIAHGGAVDAGERDRDGDLERRRRGVEVVGLHAKTVGRRDHGRDAVGVDEGVVGALRAVGAGRELGAAAVGERPSAADGL